MEVKLGFLLPTSCFLFPVCSQLKYREEGMRNLSQSFYSQLPQTADTQFAKATSELQSEVGGANVRIQLYSSWFRRKEADSRDRVFLFVAAQISYRKSGKQQVGSSLYSVMADTLDTQHAKQASQLQSQVDLQPAGDSGGKLLHDITAVIVGIMSIKTL